MLSSSFDPYLFAEHIRSDPDFIFDNTFTMPCQPTTTTFNERIEEISASSNFPPPVNASILEDGDTITASLPEWPLSPAQDATINVEVHSIEEHPDESLDILEAHDTSPTLGVAQGHGSKDRVDRDNPNLDESTEHERTESSSLVNGDESDCESPSEVHSVPYADDSEDDLDIQPSHRISLQANHPKTPTPTQGERLTDRKTTLKSHERFDGVVITVPSNNSPISGYVTSLEPTRTTRDIAPISMFNFWPGRSPMTFQSTISAEATTPTDSSIRKSPYSSVPETSLVSTSRKEEVTQNKKIKREPSSSSDLPSSVEALSTTLQDLTKRFKDLDNQLTSETTAIDGISFRLKKLSEEHTALLASRKSLLDRRKSLEGRIKNNRDDLKSTKSKGEKFQMKQGEFIEKRDRTQYQLDVLVEERRNVRKELCRKRYEVALERQFPDKGCREVARTMGWQPALDPDQHEDERSIIAPEEEQSDEDDESEEEDIQQGDKKDWLRVANALMTGDQSLDLRDLSTFQQGLGALDEQVKQEDRDQVKHEQTPPLSSPTASTPVKAESGTTTALPIPEPPSMLNTIPTTPPSDSTQNIATSEVTLANLQAHFKAIQQHQEEAARMLKLLSGGNIVPAVTTAKSKTLKRKAVAAPSVISPPPVVSAIDEDEDTITVSPRLKRRRLSAERPMTISPSDENDVYDIPSD